ncbi:MAG TPA: glycoside hydrolase family 5 protein [Pyrinomonadaceae bacterium]|nr:glycoside hydrolase family 5 protein [Pyrinomonadaceae bacterium]
MPSKHSLLLIVVFLVLLHSTPANSQTQFVTTHGKQFLTPDGKPLILRGMNLGNWLVPEGYMFKFKSANSPRLIETVINQLVGEDEARRFWKTYRDKYITGEDIHLLKKLGFNSVRIPFNYRLFVSADDSSKLDGDGYQLLDRVVNWCKQEGLYVILDMHAAPGGQTGDNIDDSFGYPFLFESHESQELTVKIWQKIATQFQNEPTVLGYDLLNEPIATHFDANYFNPKLEPLYRKIVSGIRTVDKNHIIFLGGAQWDGNFKVFGPPFDNKLAYTFHKYWFTVNQEAIQEYVDFRDKYNVPVWMGESGENTDEWISSYRTLLEKHDLGWCFWPYKKVDATSCVSSINRPADWDEIVNFANNPRSTFEEIRKARPAKEKIRSALGAYLENIKLANCRLNRGYLNALGVGQAIE